MASHARVCFRLKDSVCKLQNILKLVPYSRTCSNSAPLSKELEHKNELFSSEQRKQIESVGRIEKITVKVFGPPEDLTLYMNKDISTPYDCAKHISESVTKQAALALVNSEQWDMHRPLVSSCDLKFLYFNDEDPAMVNRAFWESCSIILGKVICSAFKDDVTVMLHSYPLPEIRTGSFVYDVQLSLKNWEPKLDELRILGSQMMIFSNEDHKFERLRVSRELALEIMKGNPFKEEQVELTTSKSQDNKLTLYRIGSHIDICEGPLISSTAVLSRCSVTAAHQLQSDIDTMYRFQGVALPKPLMLNHFAFSILESRARKMNPGAQPGRKKKQIVSS